MTLTEFLTARLDEREQDRLDELDRASRIRVAAHPNQQTGQRVAMCDDCNDWATEGSADAVKAAGAAHVREQHDPERVLADIAAKRRIVKRYASAVDEAAGWPTNPETEAILMALQWPLMDLASIYSDHPDYQQEWAPGA